MKKLIVISVVFMLAGLTVLNAKTLPTVAAKVPAEVKSEIVKKVTYPLFERNNLIEGEVWIKFVIGEDLEFKIVELNATNEGLGQHVKNELTDFYLKNGATNSGNSYYLKLKFDLVNIQ